MNVYKNVKLQILTQREKKGNRVRGREQASTVSVLFSFFLKNLQQIWQNAKI